MSNDYPGRDDDDDGYPYKAGDKDCVVNAAPHSDKKKGGLHRYRIEFSSEGLSDEDTRLFCTFFYECESLLSTLKEKSQERKKTNF